MQRNWIGKSVGAEIDFKLNETDKKLKFLPLGPIQFMEHLLLQYPLIIKLY